MKNTKLKLTTSMILLVCSVTSFGQAMHWLTQPLSEAGTVSNGLLEPPKISANGRFVSFVSNSSNITENDNNVDRDLFVYDRLTNTSQLASEVSPGDTGSIIRIGSSLSSISKPTSNGQFVAFLASSFINNEFISRAIYVKNLITGELVRADIDADGNEIEFDFLSLNLMFLSDDGTELTTVDVSNVKRINLLDQSVSILTLSADNSEPLNGFINNFSISPSGRFVVFSSEDDDVVVNDVSDGANVYLRDTVNMTNQLITIQPNGMPSQFSTFIHRELAVSNAGTVVFRAENDDLVAGDINETADLFYYDGTDIIRIAEGLTQEVLMSAAGNEVVFNTFESLVPGDNNDLSDIYQYNTNNNQVTKLTNHQGTPSKFPKATSLSANGEELLISSLERQFNGLQQDYGTTLFHHNLTSAITTPIEPAISDAQVLLGGILSSFISSDQRYVVINSAAPNIEQNLINDDSNDVFLVDRETDLRTRIAINAQAISFSTDGRYALIFSQFFQPQGDIDLGDGTIILYDRINNTYQQIISASNGQVNNQGMVVFSTFDSLVAEDNNQTSDIYLFDSQNNSLSLVSKNLMGDAANNRSTSPDIADTTSQGTWIVFQSRANDLISADLNNQEDVFMQNWPSGNINRVSQTPAGIGGNSRSERPQISVDGEVVAFSSFSNNFVPDDTNFDEHIFVYQRNTQDIELVSRDNDQNPIVFRIGDRFNFSLSDTGRYVAFNSNTTFLSDDPDSNEDVFLVDRSQSNITLISRSLDGDDFRDDFSSAKVVEDTTVSPNLLGVLFHGAGSLAGIENHPGSTEAFLYQQGGPNVDLTVEVIGSGSISGSLGISCMTSCDYDYALGTELNLVASASAGFVFDRWSSSRGQCTDDSNPCQLIMDQTKTIQAIFIDENDFIFSDGFE